VGVGGKETAGQLAVFLFLDNPFPKCHTGQREKTMKIGLDIHGVIDAKPLVFSALSKGLVKAGHEVHILTGPKFGKVEALLKQHDISYTHFFSIVENAVKNNIGVRWADENNPWIDDKTIWDRSKGEYAKLHDLDLHIDDSEDYGKYFETPYGLFKDGVIYTFSKAYPFRPLSELGLQRETPPDIQSILRNLQEGKLP
jgi:hypothetical protein